MFKKYPDAMRGPDGRNSRTEPWKQYAPNNKWAIDLVPKLLMANGDLTNILVLTEVTRYMEFSQVAGSYVQQGNGPRATVAKVPSTAAEALSSPLMGLFEKRRAKRFLEWVGSFDENNPSMHQGMVKRSQPETHSHDIRSEY